MKKKTKKALLLAAVLAAGLTMKIYTAAAAEQCRIQQQDQFAGERWDENAVQLSSFFPKETALSAEEIAEIRKQLNFSIADDTETASWYDAYSCEGKTVQVLGAKRVSKSTELMLVSEHYFRIHRFSLLCGNYLTAADASSRRVVLDENAAWILFGSSDIAGMEVTIDSCIYEVAGVVADVRRAEDDAYPRIYMLYSDYTAAEEENPPITCYEAVLHEPVEGYGLTCFEEAVQGAVNMPVSGISTEHLYHIVQNTGRFSSSAVRDYLKSITDYTTRTKAIAYPDHENAALIALHRIAGLTLLGISGLILTGAALAGVCILYRYEIKRCILHLMKYIKKLFHKNQTQEVSHNESTQKNNIHPDSICNAHDDALRMHAGK